MWSYDNILILSFNTILCLSHQKELIALQNINLTWKQHSNKSGAYRVVVADGYRPHTHSLAKYVVSIRTNEYINYFGDNHICGGAIVAVNLILTASHCFVKDYVAEDLSVIASTPKRYVETNDTERIGVAEIIKYTCDAKETCDLTMLRLQTNITLNGVTAAVIRLPTSGPKVGTVCTMLGWGSLYYLGPEANDLVYVDLIIMRNQWCEETLYKVFGFQHSFCAADPDNMEKSACHGDSGGPLICNDELTGLVSFGSKQCDSNYGATVFIDVYDFLDFIKENISSKRSHMYNVYLAVALLILF